MVSIIIPYYNRPKKLKRCLNSILIQTYQDFEILVVDDYSTIPLNLEGDSRIKVFRNQKNLGPGLSRNVGLENFNGEYIAFLDSDDYWDSFFLQKCLEQFKDANNNPGMVFTNTLSVTKTGSFPKRKWETRTETILPNILINNRPWATSSCLWRADIIKNTKWINTRSWEDYVFDVCVALKCNNVSQIDEFLVFYDVEGNDKLSKSNYFNRSIEKTYSLLKIHMLLKNTRYIKIGELRVEIVKELITSLETIKYLNYTKGALDKKILISLKDLQNAIIFNLVNLSYYGLNNRMAPRILNKIKKCFY